MLAETSHASQVAADVPGLSGQAADLNVSAFQLQECAGETAVSAGSVERLPGQSPRAIRLACAVYGGLWEHLGSRTGELGGFAAVAGHRFGQQAADATATLRAVQTPAG